MTISFDGEGFSGGKPLAETVYESMWSNITGLGKVENYTGKGQGGYTDAKLYAQAKAIAAFIRTGRRLLAQIEPETAFEKLAEREALYSVIVPAGATLAERRLALKAAMRLPGDGSYGDIRQALVDLLGDTFVALRRLDPGHLVSTPDLPGEGPGLFLEPTDRRLLFQLAQAVTSPGQMSGEEPFVYVNLDGSTVAPDRRLVTGERIALEPEHGVLRECVQVIASTEVDGQAAVRAVLAHPHQADAKLTTQPWPYWSSNRRHWIVELTPGAALDAETRRLVHQLLRKSIRSVTTWSLVEGTGPFVAGTSLVGATPL